MATKPVPLVATWAGGLWSSAMVVGLVNTGRKPDLVLFADTAAELPATYAYRCRIDQWLLRHGVKTTLAVSGQQHGQRTLEGYCGHQGVLPSPNGLPSCGQVWKSAVLEQAVRDWLPCKTLAAAGGKIDWAVPCDGSGRAHVGSASLWNVWLPILDWGWDAADCRLELLGAGLDVPTPPTCFFCPAMRPAEVLDLKECHEALFGRAVILELAARQKLGGNWSWAEAGATDFKLGVAARKVTCGSLCREGNT